MKKVSQGNLGIGRYPTDNEINVDWTKAHKISLILASALIFGLFICYYDRISEAKILSVIGLYVDIVGVVVASLKTPYYGAFYDGGQIEIKRQNVERKYFQIGMFLVGLGMILQAIGTIVQ